MTGSRAEDSVSPLPDLDCHVREYIMSVPDSLLYLSILRLAMRAHSLPYSTPSEPGSPFPSRTTRLGPVVTFFRGGVARLTPPQLRGLVLHAADCAMVPLPLWTSCLLGSFGGGEKLRGRPGGESGVTVLKVIAWGI